MQETILSRLEASRKELLDLGLRNPLLNYKTPKSRGLHLINEKSAAIFEILVKQGKAMTFLAKLSPARPDLSRPDLSRPDLSRPDFDSSSKSEELAQPGLPELHQPEQEAAWIDTKLQTNDTEQTLQTKLLNTYYAARTSIEEQGINILYLALGQLQWYDSSSSEEVRLAPLLLVPVFLERSTARDRFKLRYTAAELEANLSLQTKVKTEFGLVLPDLPEPDDFDPLRYFEEIAQAVSATPRWKVEPDEIVLGFFSFGKFMIYHDLDGAKWPEENRPDRHAIVQALFFKGFQEPKPSIAEDAFLDSDTEADQLFQAVDADSSQLLAMLAVHEGRNLVIQGPPGTGKSQTITNIIANAIGQGKKVLFVAEKMAALEVVKRRLDAINLGEACLELHSHKANKRELHGELRRVLELGKPALSHYQQEVALLGEYKDELNAYSLAVNTEIRGSGLSPFDIFGLLLQIGERVGRLTLPKVAIKNFDQWDRSHMQRAEAIADRIQARLKAIGQPRRLLFWGIKRLVMLPQEQEEVQQVLQHANQQAGILAEATKAASRTFGIEAIAARRDAQVLEHVAELLSRQPSLQELTLENSAWLHQKSDLQELLEAGRQLAVLHETYKDIFIGQAWDQPVLEIRENLLAYGEQWYRFLIGPYRKSNKQLRGLLKVPLPKAFETKLTYVNDLLKAKELAATLVQHESLARQLFGNRWQGLRSDWPSLTEAGAYLAEVHQQISMQQCPPEVLSHLAQNPKPAIAATHHQQLSTALQQHQKSIETLLHLLEFDEAVRFPETPFLEQPFAQEQTLLGEWMGRLPEIHQAISWNNLTESVQEERLQPLLDLAIHWPLAKDFLKVGLQKTWFEHLLEQAFLQHPALRKFERGSHEEAIEKFKRLDLLNLQYSQARAALRHWELIPRMEAGGQVSILRTEFNKKARHMPIRKLVQEAGLAIQAIKPVFMMSPLSIANFIPPGTLDFDLVIFDEASQVRPVEAIGAILRGRQLVVVGDTKQLPPTSFFDSLTKEVDDEENITADLQSILGMCDAQGAPQRMLRWHYRSRHESLIGLSNHEFYENKLVIFPSPGSSERLGLVLHHLRDTAYDRGKTRTNPREAAAVVDAVMAHARLTPHLSLGVVAFSTAQMQALQYELEMRRRNNPELEALFFKTHQHEPFFIKNLENVQGDERDVIFISIGYGRTPEGTLSMSFGPLNNEGGERRLNVLITRAKLRCEVFTNLTAADIDADRSKAPGVRALKNFLYYAQHGRLNTGEDAALPVDSPFEDLVAAQLEQRGFVVRQQLGSQHYSIDMAVVDPDHPDRYLLGIECDGASYHAARSARDRDRLRQQVLERGGWRLHRIWSTDWFRNPEQELKRVIEAIHQAQQQSKEEEDAEGATALELGPQFLREVPKVLVSQVPLYTCAQLSETLAEQELHLHSLEKLAACLHEIVQVEAPVHVDEVARRMMEAARISRTGSRIKQTLQEAMQYAEKKGMLVVKGDFLWDPNRPSVVVRDRSSLPVAARKLRYIAAKEMNLAIEKVVREAIAIEPAEAVTAVSRVFGFSRLSEEMKSELLEVVALSIEEGILVQDGEWLRIANGM